MDTANVINSARQFLPLSLALTYKQGIEKRQAFKLAKYVINCHKFLSVKIWPVSPYNILNGYKQKRKHKECHKSVIKEGIRKADRQEMRRAALMVGRARFVRLD